MQEAHSHQFRHTFNYGAALCWDGFALLFNILCERQESRVRGVGEREGGGEGEGGGRVVSFPDHVFCTHLAKSSLGMALEDGRKQKRKGEREVNGAALWPIVDGWVLTGEGV